MAVLRKLRINPTEFNKNVTLNRDVFSHFFLVVVRLPFVGFFLLSNGRSLVLKNHKKSEKKGLLDFIVERKSIE